MRVASLLASVMSTLEQSSTCLTTFIVADQDLAVDNGCLGFTVTATSSAVMLSAIAQLLLFFFARRTQTRVTD